MIRLRGLTVSMVTSRVLANGLGLGPPDMRLNRRTGTSGQQNHVELRRATHFCPGPTTHEYRSFWC